MKTGEVLTKNARETAAWTAVGSVLIGRYCARHNIQLSTDDALTYAGILASVVMYVSTHWRSWRIARIADAIGDRLEAEIRGDAPD